MFYVFLLTFLSNSLSLSISLSPCQYFFLSLYPAIKIFISSPCIFRNLLSLFSVCFYSLFSLYSLNLSICLSFTHTYSLCVSVFLSLVVLTSFFNSSPSIPRNLLSFSFQTKPKSIRPTLSP